MSNEANAARADLIRRALEGLDDEGKHALAQHLGRLGYGSAAEQARIDRARRQSEAEARTARLIRERDSRELIALATPDPGSYPLWTAARDTVDRVTAAQEELCERVIALGFQPEGIHLRLHSRSLDDGSIVTEIVAATHPHGDPVARVEVTIDVEITGGGDD